MYIFVNKIGCSAINVVFIEAFGIFISNLYLINNINPWFHGLDGGDYKTYVCLNLKQITISTIKSSQVNSFGSTETTDRR